MPDQLLAVGAQPQQPGLAGRAPALRARARTVDPGRQLSAACVDGRSSTEYYRDIADHLARLQISIDTIRDTIGTAIQVNLSMLTIEKGDMTERLAAWAGIFAVATFFVGVWGMTFEVIPGLRQPWGCPAALVVIAGTGGVMFWRFRRAGWL